MLPLAGRAGAQENKCGVPPALPTKTQDEESIKGQLQTQADLLSKLVGKAELGGQIAAAKKQIYQSSDKFYAAQKEAYLSYLFCILITQDKSLSTTDKLNAIVIYKNSGQSPANSAEKTSVAKLAQTCANLASTAGGLNPDNYWDQRKIEHLRSVMADGGCSPLKE
jgi:hypothetical protein